jgi:hypothetical protein
MPVHGTNTGRSNLITKELKLRLWKKNLRRGLLGTD